ncbi:MAG TPA: riboflavin synthase [Nocardioidaceae bacterium]|nr:riboflavin synthase [Nocardioidaceae bacterium]
MFTGIVEALGKVAEIEDRGDAVRLTVHGPEVLGDARPGDSIAVDGCCLTVAEVRDGAFTADVMRQTLRLTTLGGRAVGDRVNLERAVTASTRLGGHLMSGHVDATGPVLAREPSAHWELVRIGLPTALSRYVVPQGSVAVDGVSLTVVEISDMGVHDGWFTVSLIPETLRRTTLGARAVGDPVNLEVDVIGKYVERQLGTRGRER